VQWAPRTAETALAGAGAVAAAMVAVTLDPAGRLLLGLAAVCLAALAVADLVLRPRLRADADGIELRRLDGRRRLPWSAVREVRVDVHNRYGLASRTLELDTDDDLVLLGRRSLGADPRDVAEALRQIRVSRYG
jgi:Bacterial PH domain